MSMKWGKVKLTSMFQPHRLNDVHIVKCWITKDILTFAFVSDRILSKFQTNLKHDNGTLGHVMRVRARAILARTGICAYILAYTNY